MPALPCVIGLDVSTTASKAVCIDAEGNVLGQALNEHEISGPYPLWSEQDPDAWWDAMRQSIRAVLELPSVNVNMVKAVGVTGQMHGLVLLDSNGKVLRPAMLWNDGRSGRQCKIIRERIGLKHLVATTGNDAFTGFTAPKLLWVRDHEPNCYAKIAQILLPKDYIRWKLSDVYATDRAGAGGTLLLNLSTRTWASDLLEALDIPEAWLPSTHEGTECTGFISRVCASETGLLEGIPVYAGGGDQAAQAVGVGAIDPGTWAVTLGTSGVVFAPSNRPRVDPLGRAHAFPHAIPETWHMMGVMLSAAGSLQWYRDTLASHIPYEQLLSEAAEIVPGSEGLYFHPYLSGERTPHADPLLRGSFVGLTTRHRRAHLTRAVLEGVAYGLRDNLQLLYKAGLSSPERILISGGGANSSLWRQILADIMGHPLSVVEVTEGAAIGAALLAGTGADIWNSIQEACNVAVSVQEQSTPGKSAQLYAGLHEEFKKLYPCLGEFFHT